MKSETWTAPKLVLGGILWIVFFIILGSIFRSLVPLLSPYMTVEDWLRFTIPWSVSAFLSTLIVYFLLRRWR